MLKSSLLLLLVGLVFVACDRNCIVEKRVDIPQATWNKDSVARVDVPIADTLSYCSILLTFRNSDDYPNSNIIFSVTAIAPSGAAMCDTVEYRLMDGPETWGGKTSGKWIDHRLAFRADVKFAQAGNYQFRIAHLMRNEDLKGVGAVGVRIEKME